MSFETTRRESRTILKNERMETKLLSDETRWRRWSVTSFIIQFLTLAPRLKKQSNSLFLNLNKFLLRPFVCLFVFGHWWNWSKNDWSNLEFV